MAEFTDTELLAELRDALAAPPMRPDEATLARLHDTLERLGRELEPVQIGAAHRHDVGRRSARNRRRRITARTPVFVAGAVAVALSAGVAAAAVATNTLPGPTRAFAYDLGLPVTSPSLYRAEQTEGQLRSSIAAHESHQARRLARRLEGQLKDLDAGDLGRIRRSANTLLVEVGLGLASATTSVPAPVTTTVTIPSMVGSSSRSARDTRPSLRVPRVITPGLGVPSVSVPSVSIPHATLPPVPRVTVPTITVPGLPPL